MGVGNAHDLPAHDLPAHDLLSQSDRNRVRGIGLDQLTNGREGDGAGGRIFDAEDGSCDGGGYVRFFEGEVGVDHFAVDEGQVFAVAKGLRSDDDAMIEGHVFAIPRQVFAFDGRIFHHHVFGVPEGVLGVQIAILKEGVFDVLKGIFSLHGEVAEGEIA